MMSLHESENEMTDEQFLSYVTSHSRTPRALFSRAMLHRLLELADAAGEYMFTTEAAFIQMHADIAAPLVAAAEKRIARPDPVDRSVRPLSVVMASLNGVGRFKDNDK